MVEIPVSMRSCSADGTRARIHMREKTGRPGRYSPGRFLTQGKSDVPRSLYHRRAPVEGWKSRGRLPLNQSYPAI